MPLNKPQKHGNDELLAELAALLQKYHPDAAVPSGVGVVQPHIDPIVKPAVLATSGDLKLYADGSIGADSLDAYNAGYSGQGYTCYGIFFADSESVFPQITSDPTLRGSFWISQANLHSPFGQISPNWGQGSAATLSPDGHGYVHGSVHAIRGTLATTYKTTDLPALLDLWARSDFHPVQIEQGASGKPFP